MAEADKFELAERLRYHVQALTSELGLAAPDDTLAAAPARAGTLSLAHQRLVTAKAWVAASRAPGRAFNDEGMFANPALSLLLDLYINRAEHRSVSISSACIAAGVPATTGLRWIERLVRTGHIMRAADASDGRRALVWISDSALARMDNMLDSAAEGDRKLGLSRITFTG